MHDSRKTLLNVLIDNLVNVFNIAIVILFIILVLNQSYLYLIPLTLSLLASIFSLALDVRHYLLSLRIHQRLNVLVDGKEVEKSLSSLKIGDHVVLYPGETINFVGEIIKGTVYVNESSINGTTKLVNKVSGSSVVNGSIVSEGSGVVEVKELKNKRSKTTFANITKLAKRIKLLNLVFSAMTLLIIGLTFIFDKDNLNNVSKCAITGTPYLLNIILTIYLYALSRKNNKGIRYYDSTFLSELNDVDVVCLDKTGTLTTGEFEIFKTVIISQSSVDSIALDPNRAFDQTISNILRTTKETGGYYKMLQEHYIYDVTKIITDSSSIRDNGLYSAISIKGGSTYALGEPENFEIANLEAASSIMKEYETMGYRILMLVESKNPLKSGLIDGKCTAVGLIILQETIRESAKELIKYCLENGKQVKVISGDRIATVSEVCRKAGLENIGKATSIKLIPFEKIGLLLENDVVFADATPSQKAFIVKELQKNGHHVAFIGDGDNDTQALKAANVAISLSDGSKSAIKCSHASVDDLFTLTKAFVENSKVFKNKMDSLTAITYSQNAFTVFYLLVFMIASLINKDIVNPFGYMQLLMWSLFGIIIPSIFLLTEKANKPEDRSFFRNFIGNSIVLIVPVAILYILQLFQYNGVGFYGLPSDLNDMHETLITSSVVNNLSCLSIIIVSLVIVYNHFSPFNKTRTIAFVMLILLPIVYGVLLGFNIDTLSFITQIETSILTGINYFVMAVVTAICSALYLLVLDIIGTVKGENQNVKSKSKD